LAVAASQGSREAYQAPSPGHIINIGSGVSTLTRPTRGIHRHKGAVDAITDVLARTRPTPKIRVKSLNPGMIETEGVAKPQSYLKRVQLPGGVDSSLGRIGQTEIISP